MDWIERLNACVDYIEENLDQEIDNSRLARIACCSLIHFQRMFAFVAGMGLSDYVRQRKMTLAAFDLLNSSEKIIDIALKYGYNSPTAFTRAFTGFHGIAPSQVKARGIPIKSFPRITFYMSIKGGREMQYRMEEKPAMRFVGKKEAVSTAGGQNLIRIPQMWQESMDGTFDKILELSEGEPTGVLGVCGNYRESDFDYFIASSTAKPVPAGMDELLVPAGLWVIFDCRGPMPGAIQEGWKRIYSEWFPSSGYEHAGTAELEWYSDGDPKEADYLSEVWIPVVKK